MQRSERSFIKNGKERKDRNVLLKRMDAQPCLRAKSATDCLKLSDFSKLSDLLKLSDIYLSEYFENTFLCNFLHISCLFLFSVVVIKPKFNGYFNISCIFIYFLFKNALNQNNWLFYNQVPSGQLIDQAFLVKKYVKTLRY